MTSPMPDSTPAHLICLRRSGHASLTNSGVQGAIPDCIYGAKCYRKNPQHFKEVRRPGLASSLTIASQFNHPSGVGPAPAAAAPPLTRVNSSSKKDFQQDLKNKPENQKVRLRSVLAFVRVCVRVSVRLYSLTCSDLRPVSPRRQGRAHR